MIEDGRTYGLMIALQHLLRTLEQKGILTTQETIDMLDGVLADLRASPLVAEAAADAHKIVGGLYLPIRPEPSRQ
jgi:hypothetical protein